MNNTWSLDDIYPGFDDPTFEADMQKLNSLITEMEQLCADLNAAVATEILRRGILLEEETFLLHNRLFTFARLKVCTDAKNVQASSAKTRISGIYSRMAGPLAAFYGWACTLPDLMELVEKDELLRQYSFLFGQKLRAKSHQLPEGEEKLFAQMSLSGANSWLALFHYTVGKQTVSWQGKEISLAAMGRLHSDPDMEIRKAAYEAELNCLDGIKDTIAHCLNGVKLQTLTECKLRGYDSPLAMSIERNKLSQKILDTMLETIRDGLPLFRRYLKAKAKLLGHKNGLPWYDLSAPIGTFNRSYTAEEARTYLVELFSTFDPASGELIDKAFRDRWIDLYPQSGKQGGAFCTRIPSIKQSRVMTNFNGRLSGLNTLAHELGHAYHHLCTREHRPLNGGYGYCLSETASNFNEQLFTGAALNKAETDEEKLAILEMRLNGTTSSICEIYARFLFEKRVFDNRQDQFLDADTLSRYMTDARKEAFGDALDENYLHPYAWVSKSHYYGFPYYNYPYAFGDLLSRGLYAQYRKKGADFVPEYKNFLYNTTVANCVDLAKLAGLDFEDKAFWQDAFKTIEEQVALFCRLAEQ